MHTKYDSNKKQLLHTFAYHIKLTENVQAGELVSDPHDDVTI